MFHKMTVTNKPLDPYRAVGNPLGARSICVPGCQPPLTSSDFLDLFMLPLQYSLIWDLLSGLNYLHHSDLHLHGNLKSSNCLVDSRFVLRLSGFGPRFLARKTPTPFEDMDDAHVEGG